MARIEQARLILLGVPPSALGIELMLDVDRWDVLNIANAQRSLEAYYMRQRYGRK